MNAKKPIKESGVITFIIQYANDKVNFGVSGESMAIPEV